MIIKGNKHRDARGTLCYNNDFDATQIKRIYTIENCSTEFVRGWQGHRIEQRWFSVISGGFEISVIKVDDFENPTHDLPIIKHKLTSEGLHILHIPAGCLTAIQALEDKSKLLVMADYALGVTQDEYRFPFDYFKS